MSKCLLGFLGSALWLQDPDLHGYPAEPASLSECLLAQKGSGGRGGEESGPLIVMTSLFIDLHFISLLYFSGEISSRGRRCKSIYFLMHCPHVCNMQCLSMHTCFSRAELLHSHVYFPVFFLYIYIWIYFCRNNMVKFNQWSYVKMYLFTFVILF